MMQASLGKGRTVDPKTGGSKSPADAEEQEGSLAKSERGTKWAKKEPKSEEDISGYLSASEGSISKEQMMVKEEVWNEESNEKRGRNREALDQFAREHQKRVKKERGNPVVRRKRVALCERDSEGTFEPMKGKVFPKSEPNESGEEDSKENANTANTAGRSSEDESSHKNVGSRTSLVDRTVGPWDSVSQTTKGTQSSGAKKAVQSMGKQAMKKRKRRMQPEIARKQLKRRKNRRKGILSRPNTCGDAWNSLCEGARLIS